MTIRLRMAVALATLSLSIACQSTATAPSRLDATPRHDEWVDVAQGTRNVKVYVVYPQRATKGPAVLVIHENRGLTDWVRTVADRLAEEGYIALAPDLLSGMAPGGGKTKDFASEDAARQAIGALPRAQYLADLKAVAEYAGKIPSSNGHLFAGGFCWGGSRTWDVASEIGGIDAAFVFYGTGPPDAAVVGRIAAPVYGFYGGNDERVNATIPQSAEAMKSAGKTYDPVTYPGAGHAFMRLGELADADPANAKARGDAWARWLKLLSARR